jgi:hypothetical protein
MKSIKCPRQPDDPRHNVLYVELVEKARKVIEASEDELTVEDSVVYDNVQDEWLECEWCGRIDPEEIGHNPNLYVRFQ